MRCDRAVIAGEGSAITPRQGHTPLRPPPDQQVISRPRPQSAIVTRATELEIPDVEADEKIAVQIAVVRLLREVGPFSGLGNETLAARQGPDTPRPRVEIAPYAPPRPVTRQTGDDPLVNTALRAMAAIARMALPPPPVALPLTAAPPPRALSPDAPPVQGEQCRE